MHDCHVQINAHDVQNFSRTLLALSTKAVLEISPQKDTHEKSSQLQTYEGKKSALRGKVTRRALHWSVSGICEILDGHTKVVSTHIATPNTSFFVFFFAKIQCVVSNSVVFFLCESNQLENYASVLLGLMKTRQVQFKSDFPSIVLALAPQKLLMPPRPRCVSYKACPHYYVGNIVRPRAAW